MTGCLGNRCPVKQQGQRGLRTGRVERTFPAKYRKVNEELCRTRVADEGVIRPRLSFRPIHNPVMYAKSLKWTRESTNIVTSGSDVFNSHNADRDDSNNMHSICNRASGDAFLHEDAERK